MQIIKDCKEKDTIMSIIKTQAPQGTERYITGVVLDMLSDTKYLDRLLKDYAESHKGDTVIYSSDVYAYCTTEIMRGILA